MNLASETFCNNLKEARKAKEFTQKQVADILHIAEYRYANWEQGRAEPSIEDLRNICYILEISANYLLGLEDEFGNKLKIHYTIIGEGAEIMKAEERSWVQTPNIWDIPIRKPKK